MEITDIRTLLERRLDGLIAAGDLPGLVDRASRDRFVACIDQSLVDHDAIRNGQNLPKALRGPAAPFQPFNEIKRLAATDWDEAFWLTFLATHIGWDRPDSVGALYRSLDEGEAWTWTRVSADGGEAFARWADENSEALHRLAPFGNHRKYQSHRPPARSATSKVVRSFIPWALRYGPRIRQRCTDFGELYRSLAPVNGLGRTGRFDVLRVTGLLGLAELRPDRCYFRGSSGPRIGARLLFGGKDEPFEWLEARALRLSRDLGLDLQNVEDSVCQWQKGIGA